TVLASPGHSPAQPGAAAGRQIVGPGGGCCWPHGDIAHGNAISRQALQGSSTPGAGRGGEARGRTWCVLLGEKTAPPPALLTTQPAATAKMKPCYSSLRGAPLTTSVVASASFGPRLVFFRGGNSQARTWSVTAFSRALLIVSR